MRAILRLCLAALLAFAPLVEARAVCVIDGNPPAIGTTFSPSVTTRTILFTTAQPNDIIVFPISAVSETDTSYAFPNAVSIVCTAGCTGTPPTFTRRFQHQASVPGCWSGGTCYVDTEEWTASAPTALSSVTLTIIMQMDLGYASLKPFGVHGSSGFDANGSLTALGTDLSGASSTIQVSGVSTTSSPDFGIFSCDASVATAPGACQQGNNSGWSTINSITQQNIFIGFGLNSKMLIKPLAAPVSGITMQPINGTSQFWFSWADAMVCSGSSAFPQVQILD